MSSQQCPVPSSPLHVLVQDAYVDVGGSPEHIVGLMFPANRVQGASDEVGPLVGFRRSLREAARVLRLTNPPFDPCATSVTKIEPPEHRRASTR